MEPSEFGWIIWLQEVLPSFLEIFWSWLIQLGQALTELQTRYPLLLSPQTLIGLFGAGFAVWRWWEAREANLFRKFEEMIERNESELVKARDGLADVMLRPGPGVRIRPPLFVSSDLHHALSRRGWSPQSLFPLTQPIDRRLERAIATSGRKVSAHTLRLSLYRHEIASARIIQGALAATRATHVTEAHEREKLELEAYDRFQEVLALPGHREDVVALELLATQLLHMEGEDQRPTDAYRRLIAILQRQDETPSRNMALARAKRSLAVLRYSQLPTEAQQLLSDGIALVMRLGPPRDRHMLELADIVRLSGIAHMRLGATKQGPRQLMLAQTYYRNLLRSLNSRRRGLFRWMYESTVFSGHRPNELIRRAQIGLAETQHLLSLFNSKGSLLVRSLRRGHGARRRNRRPKPPPRVH